MLLKAPLNISNLLLLQCIAWGDGINGGTSTSLSTHRAWAPRALTAHRDVLSQTEHRQKGQSKEVKQHSQGHAAGPWLHQDKDSSLMIPHLMTSQLLRSSLLPFLLHPNPDDSWAFSSASSPAPLLVIAGG